LKTLQTLQTLPCQCQLTSRHLTSRHLASRHLTSRYSVFGNKVPPILEQSSDGKERPLSKTTETKTFPTINFR